MIDIIAGPRKIKNLTLHERKMAHTNIAWEKNEPLSTDDFKVSPIIREDIYLHTINHWLWWVMWEQLSLAI